MKHPVGRVHDLQVPDLCHVLARKLHEWEIQMFNLKSNETVDTYNTYKLNKYSFTISTVS